MQVNSYDAALDAEDVVAGRHREMVGGLWDTLGELQLRFLVEHGGLRPEHRLLDVGCGCLRGGVHFIPYLEPGNYFGIDINASLINAGYDLELLRHGLQGRLPRENLRVSSDFALDSFGVTFDRILAVSVWTHLPLNHIALSLLQVSSALAPEGRFFATYFEIPEGQSPAHTITHPGGITSYSAQDPYHYGVEDFAYLLQRYRIPLAMHRIGAWNHPRHQMMLEFRRDERGASRAGMRQLQHIFRRWGGKTSSI
ncbi:MAG: class I SAM-dependent methyltransferase [Acidithiobacillus ferrooxidans]|nr:class I SAM-dependent methyltransferase [Acidithiobacillus ferrooxidans]MDD5002614.1 class I SAM-dependent methyltransferase [Acidithiobacillus sp.]MDD5379135.1 class I SAM-dependent methyltransferase [Acidithiobacillus sp.]MDD5575510.1 class I SAM-dependent methyltransferase [Acidithiobacillus sp.]